MSLLCLDTIGYSYDNKKTMVLDNLSYAFDKGRIYAVTGKSGAGKTTLLSLLSGLAVPTRGRILFEGRDITRIDRYQYRSRHVGVIFQSYNLLPHLTAAENVELSMDVAGVKMKNKKQFILSLLEKVELDEKTASRRILKLSGGEQQRVAIARALSYEPDIILADEPTGNLDLITQEEVMSIFRRLAHEEQKCIIIVSHSPEVAALADEVFELAPLKKTHRAKSEKPAANA